MAPRAPPPPLHFTQDGLYASALPEESLLQALSRRRVPVLGRSMRYHRPRGPICGTGQCAGCLVRVNGVPNVRACRVFPSPGDKVETENAWPSVRHDAFSVFDTLFPDHIDTMHGFTRPLFLRGAYQKVIRRLAGTGRLPDAGSEVRGLGPPGEVWQTDILVVGGGPVGTRAALQMANSPFRPRVLLLERGFGPVPAAARLPSSVGVKLATSLTFLPPPALSGDPQAPQTSFVGLAVQEGGGCAEVRVKQVLLATGAYDAFLLFSGNDRPGVLTGDGALALVPPSGRPPFERALLFGGGMRALELLQRLRGRIAAVAAPGPIVRALEDEARSQQVPLLPSHLLLSARGRKRVRGAVLRDRRTGDPRRLEVDAIILGHRRVPHVPLLFQAGARMHWRSGTGAYYPDLDAHGATSVPGLFAAGELAGYAEAGASLQSADRAVVGLMTAGGAPSAPAPEEGRVESGGDDAWVRYYWELLERSARGKRILCPCEDVVDEEVHEAVHEGFEGMEVAKRFTGVGTGVCQGRYCLPDAILLLSLYQGCPASEVGFITQRPPTWPVPLAALAQLPGGSPSAPGAPLPPAAGSLPAPPPPPPSRAPPPPPPRLAPSPAPGWGGRGS